ncbi:MAG: ribosome recycling factor [Rickettsiales bacterium]|nr:ribosome recycling factor [Rickettsiales bacterium]|tara:strand:+ start:315 stop:869 length:555 start_codon:yes stop_codon:yes gene_type:complete
MEFKINDLREKMLKSIEILKKEFSGLRTGRASVGLIEPVQVEAYGSKVPISQIANIGIPEPRMLTVQVWDASLVASVENAIRTSNLGLNPMTEGNLIRLPIPDLTEDRRKEIVKLASKYSEDSKIVIRNIRRDAMDNIKLHEKKKEISKDELFQFSDEIQKLTDELILDIDNLYIEKEKDILKV